MKHCATCSCPPVKRTIPVTHWLVDLIYLAKQSEPVWQGAWASESPELVKLVQEGYANLKTAYDGREGVVISSKGWAAIRKHRERLIQSGWKVPRRGETVVTL